jgi:hypothetical protein
VGFLVTWTYSYYNILPAGDIMPIPPERDRRRHVVYVTRNTEYHCRDQECVGVRDRSSGRWNSNHPALRSKLHGIIKQGQVLPGQSPGVGHRLLFYGRQAIMTTGLQHAGRPDKECIFSYTSLCWAGEITAASAA